MLLVVLMNGLALLKGNIINGRLVETVSGYIRTVEYYHGGRSCEVMKLSVIPSVKKWILMGSVTEEESAYFVKGNQIEVEVYQLHDNILRREYNQKHTLQSFGMKINNKVLRKREYAKSKVINSHYFMMGFTLFGLLVGVFRTVLHD